MNATVIKISPWISTTDDEYREVVVRVNGTPIESDKYVLIHGDVYNALSAVNTPLVKNVEYLKQLVTDYGLSTNHSSTRESCDDK